MKDPNRHLLHLLSVIILINGIGYGIIIPIIPVYARDLGASSFLLGVMVAAYAVFQVFFNAPGGMLADRIGPKRVIIAGLSLVSIASFLFTVTTDVYFFILFRAVEGAGTGMLFPATSAYVFSLSSHFNRGRYMGVFVSAMILGFTLGPAIGGVLADQFGDRMPFYFCTTISGTALILALIFLESGVSMNEGEDRTPFSKRFREIIHKKGMPAVIFRGFTIQFNNGINMMAMAVFLKFEVGLSKTLVGLVYFAQGIVMLLFTPVGGRLTDRIGRKTPIIAGGLGMAFVYFMIPTIKGFHYTIGSITINEFAYACALVTITGMGVGLNNPAAMSLITETSPGKQKGTGMGVYGTIAGIGFIIGPILAGYLYSLNVSFPFRLAALMALLSVTFVHFFVQETGRKRK